MTRFTRHFRPAPGACILPVQLFGSAASMMAEVGLWQKGAIGMCEAFARRIVRGFSAVALVVASQLPAETVGTVVNNQTASCADVLDSTAFKLLDTHPHLAVARSWIDNDAKVDVLKNTVSSRPDRRGRVREIECAPLVDGMRETFADSNRVVITVPCFLGYKSVPASRRQMTAAIERRQGGTVAELRSVRDPDRTIAIANTLPTSLPGRVPDLTGIAVDNVSFGLWRAGHEFTDVTGRNGAYTLYMSFDSSMPPAEFMAKLKAHIDSSETEVEELPKSPAGSTMWIVRSSAHSGPTLTKSTEIAPGKWNHKLGIVTALAEDLAKGAKASEDSKPAPRRLESAQECLPDVR